MILLLDDSSYTYTSTGRLWLGWELKNMRPPTGSFFDLSTGVFWPMVYYIASTSYQSESSHISANWIFIADTQLPPSWSPPHNPASHWQKEKFSLSFCQEDLKHETMLIDCGTRLKWSPGLLKGKCIKCDRRVKGMGGLQRFLSKAGLERIVKRLSLIGSLLLRPWPQIGKRGTQEKLPSSALF